MSVIKRDFLFH